MKRSREWYRGVFADVVLVILIAAPARAQFRSGVEGTVTDQTQAAVPEAEVELVRQETGVTLATRTNESGFFRITQLPPGTYRVEVRRVGFRSWVQTGLALEGNEVRTLYPVLAVGEQMQVVEVSATLASVDTGTSKITRSIEAKTIEEAPLVGRNVYSSMAYLAPGITGAGLLFGTGGGTQSIDSFQTEPGFLINAAGQRQETNEYQIDGSSVNGNSRDGIVNLTPEPDTVQEVRISANTFSAEKGRNSGALIEVYTKSGTNQFHGTLSEFHSNNVLTSRTVFQTAVPKFRRNEFGGTFGGPILKDRTFFFAGAHLLRSSVAQTDVVRVETPEFRAFVQNSFPSSLAARFLTKALPGTDPVSDIWTVARVRTSNPGRYPSDVFPADLPAVGTAFINQTLSRPAHQWNSRIDHNFPGYKDRIYFNLFRTTADNQQPQARPLYRIIVPNAGILAKLNWTHTFTTALLNEASFTYGRVSGNNPATRDSKELPNVSITGVGSGFSQWGPANWVHNNYNWHDVLSWMRGNHHLRFGFDIDRQQDLDNFTNGVNRPAFTFANILDFAQDLPFSQTGPAINVRTGGLGSGLYQRVFMTYGGGFVQDDWKVLPGFTVNMGLRVDLFTHWASALNQDIPFNFFNPGTGASFAEQVANGSMGVRGNAYAIENRPWGLGPRIGLAWDVFGNGSTAVRGGYGIYYSRIANGSFIFPLRTPPPDFATPNLSLLTGDQFSYALGSPDGAVWQLPPGVSFQIDPRGGIVGIQAGASGVEPRPTQPRTHNWTMSIQRRIGANFTAELDYLGTHSTNLYTQTDINRFPGDLIANGGRLTRLNPSFGSIIFGRTLGTSDGHLGSFMLSRRFSAGWSLRAIYTFGKALDYTSSNDNGVPDGRNVFDALNVQGQRGRSDYHVGRRVTFDSVWELPDPWKSGWKSRALAGWRLSTIAVLQSGRPFTVVTGAPFPSGDYNADGFNYDPPNTPSFGNHISASRSDFIQGLFQASAFPRPPIGQQGNLGRNTFDGPGLANVNLSAVKAVRIPWFTEGAIFEFRGEIFNLFNRVNLTQPNGDLSSGLFGRSLGQTLPRTAQFGIRIQY